MANLTMKCIKGFICVLMLGTALHVPGRAELLSWNWQCEMDVSLHNFSSLTLNTVAMSVINCVVICSQLTNTAAATFNSDTSWCGCFAELNGLSPNPGHLVWKNIPSGYDGIMNLDFFIKLYDAYWKTYDEATAYCLNDGARLSILDTTTKLDYVLALPDYDPVLYYLVGATDEAQEDTFVWTTGNIVSRDAQFWLEYQPNNAGGNQDCLTLHLSKYDDVTCTDDFKFICELV